MRRRYSDHNGSPSIIRYMENVYIREEDNDSDDEDDDDGSINSDYVNYSISTKKCTYAYIGLLLTFICIASILFVFYIYPMFISSTPSSSSSSFVHEQSLSSVQKIRTQNLTNQLSQEFQGQHKRLWAQIRSALESPFQHEYTNHQRHTTNERISPIVLLIVNRYIHSIVNNQSKQHHCTPNHNENVSFDCFITRLGQLVNHMYLSNSKNSCSILKGYQFNSLNKQKFDQMKLEFDNQLDDLYKSGSRCFHFTSIDLLPAEMVLLFHGYTDSENSIYSNSILLISLSKRFDVYESLNCTKKLEHILPGCQTAGQFEHQVNQFLRSLWNKYLGNEEVDALISRLTTNIIIFHTYDYNNNLEINSTCTQ
uniref:SEA domain-containing protein n=2 Tax=Schistosoma mansoni TaxID=6183 RepID=A0A5K4F0I2_SCHMA